MNRNILQPNTNAIQRIVNQFNAYPNMQGHDVLNEPQTLFRYLGQAVREIGNQHSNAGTSHLIFAVALSIFANQYADLDYDYDKPLDLTHLELEARPQQNLAELIAFTTWSLADRKQLPRIQNTNEPQRLLRSNSMHPNGQMARLTLATVNAFAGNPLHTGIIYLDQSVTPRRAPVSWLPQTSIYSGLGL